MAKHVVYFALRPDPAAAAEAVRLAERLRGLHGLTGRPVPPERLHVSLNSLGVAPPAQLVAKACEVVSAMRTPAFVVAFNRVASFTGRRGQRPLVLWGDEGVIGVDQLHDAIHAALAGPGIVRGPPRALAAHMTILWDAREVAERFVEPVSWRVRELVLIDSLHGEGRQELLGRWPLEG